MAIALLQRQPGRCQHAGMVLRCAAVHRAAARRSCHHGSASSSYIAARMLRATPVRELVRALISACSG
eukprot:2610508-Pleurochrysis_carterae.AAC.1